MPPATPSPSPSVEPIELHRRVDPAEDPTFAREQTTTAGVTDDPTSAWAEGLARFVWSVMEAVGIGVVLGAALAQTITFAETSSNEEKGWFLLLVAAALGGIGIVLLRRDLRSGKEPA